MNENNLNSRDNLICMMKCEIRKKHRKFEVAVGKKIRSARYFYTSMLRDLLRKETPAPILTTEGSSLKVGMITIFGYVWRA